jgi:hypothetical protein
MVSIPCYGVDGIITAELWISHYALRLPVIRRRVALNWNNWVRQTHRWLSIIFTLTVVANFIVMAIGTPPSWIVYSPLPPLFLLMFTGL